MKPSETIGIKNINKLSNTKVYILDKKTIINLDNRFIDREELKEKIKNSKISMNIDTEYYDGCRYAIKEILKLLEE